MIQKIAIDQFLILAKSNPVLDVRSPGEYNYAQIPGAYSLPLFSDEERKIVGTAYKQQSRQTAIKIGLDFFGTKMRGMVEEVEKLVVDRRALAGKQLKLTNDGQQTMNNVLVHCWRGGMRSAGVAWLLDLYGFKVYTLVGGYKAYRKWARDCFEKPYQLQVVGGYTGSGKTLVLQELKRLGHRIIDLEAIANHKGSAFGGLGEKPQPSQEMFENILAEALTRDRLKMNEENKLLAVSNQPSTINPDVIYIEDESQRIGAVGVPMPFWNQLRNSPVLFLDIPFEERLEYLVEEYGKFEKVHLVNAIMRIQKKLGGLETKNAINYLLENNSKECFRILLKYYDKLYAKGLHFRENLQELLQKIPVSKVDAAIIANILTHEKTIQ